MYQSISPTQLFQALADETRLRCVILLQQHGELCVCELTYALEVSQPKISRHLAYLKAAGVVRDRRQGVWIFYTLHPQLPAWMSQIIHNMTQHLYTKSPFSEDNQRLSGMSQRPNGRSCDTSLLIIKEKS
jgi:DNA-binding transcriptional ArsR family regulator